MNEEAHKAARLLVLLGFTWWMYDKITGNHFWFLLSRSAHEVIKEIGVVPDLW